MRIKAALGGDEVRGSGAIRGRRLFNLLLLLPILLAGIVIADDTETRGMDHFNGKQFFNPWETAGGEQTFIKFLTWIMSREKREWTLTDAPPGPPPPSRVEGDSLRVTFINHATFLLQTNGLNILTDPIWSERCSPVQWGGPKRFRAPGIRFEDLPKIDLILLSHNHYDHLDLPTLNLLAKRDSPKVITPLNNARIIASAGLNQIKELDWWEEVVADFGETSLKVTCVPAQHFSARTPFDRNKSLWAGFVFETASGPVFFAGDSGFGPFFQEIGERFGAMRLSIIPVGAYKPRWMMAHVHTDPAEAVEIHRIVKSRLSIGSHFGTFALADESMTQPAIDLEAALLASPEGSAPFRLLQEGEGLVVE